MSDRVLLVVLTRALVAAAGAGIALLAAVGLAEAQKPGGQPDPEKIQEAIQRGIHYLRTQQQEDGSWEFIREVPLKNKKGVERRHDAIYDTGLTALAALAMLENGVPPSDPAIRKAYRYVRERAPREDRTYSLALAIVLLEQLGNARDRVLVQQMAYRLLAGQLDSGGWTYVCPVNPRLERDPREIARAKRRSGIGDNSNTQFAVLGLWAAQRMRASVRSGFELVEKRFRNSQAPKGGWDYKSTGEGETATMTAAGCFVLAVTYVARQREELQGASDPQAGIQGLMSDEVFKKAYERVAQFARGIRPRTSPYLLWSLERLGVVLGAPKLGDVDWYAKGAAALLASQDSDGAWRINHKGVPDTALALLFLSRGNLARDLTYALQGDPNKPFMRIPRKGKPESFKEFRELTRLLQPGDIVEIQGNGPFEISGQVLSVPGLTIRAGKGYQPVIVRREDPLDHPDFVPEMRAMFVVRGGPVSFEGLQFRVDPETPARLPYAAIAVESGRAYVTHCRFGSEQKENVTALDLSGTCSAVVQDSFFLGFKPSILLREFDNVTLELHNCLLFGRVGIGAKTEKVSARCSIKLDHCTVHVADSVVDFGDYWGRASVSASWCVLRAEWLSRRYRPLGLRVPRRWHGEGNAYDVFRWVGVEGRGIRGVRDLQSWRDYCGGEENEKFSARVQAHFVTTRLPSVFRHDIRSTDWELKDHRLLPEIPMGETVGCDVFRLGPGPAYERFRLGQRYGRWRAQLARVQQ